MRPRKIIWRQLIPRMKDYGLARQEPTNPSFTGRVGGRVIYKIIGINDMGEYGAILRDGLGLHAQVKSRFSFEAKDMAEEWLLDTIKLLTKK